MRDTLKLQGFSRIQIGETDPRGRVKIVGDSGWHGPNQIVDLGFQDFICAAIGGVAGSKQVTEILVGTGTAPASNGTSLAGETIRDTCSNSVVASNTLQCTIAWASGAHPGGTPTLQNIALVNTSAAGTILCGNTYTTSAWATNQGVSATYQLRFS